MSALRGSWRRLNIQVRVEDDKPHWEGPHPEPVFITFPTGAVWMTANEADAVAEALKQAAADARFRRAAASGEGA